MRSPTMAQVRPGRTCQRANSAVSPFVQGAAAPGVEGLIMAESMLAGCRAALLDVPAVS
jgi:hypothetical protein